jgi:hypothetical protein
LVGISEISAAIGGLKGAMEIVKGLNSTASAVSMNEAKIGLQSAILEAQAGLLAAQEAQAANLRRIEELEQELERLQKWETQRGGYELVDVYRGAFAYMPKGGRESGETAHWLCANCFEHGRKSFLLFKGQDKNPAGGRGAESTYGCDACKSSIKVSFRTKPTWPSEGVE